MVIGEISKLFAVLSAAYAKFEVDDIKLQLWYEMLADIPYSMAKLVVKKHICESPYPPTISDIRGTVVEITCREIYELDAGSAWGEVMKCIRNYGIYNPEEALASMSKRTAEVVRRISWREICQSENLSVVRGQFVKIFEILEKRERKNMLIPERMRREIEGIRGEEGIGLLEGEVS